MNRREVIPLSFAQKRQWLLYKLQGRSPAYNIPLAPRLEGDPDMNALRSALCDVVGRHESLRTIFPDQAGIPEQKIMDPKSARPAVTLPSIPRSGLSSH